MTLTIDIYLAFSSIIMGIWRNASRTQMMLEWGELVKPWLEPMRCKFVKLHYVRDNSDIQFGFSVIKLNSVRFQIKVCDQLKKINFECNGSCD